MMGVKLCRRSKQFCEVALQRGDNVMWENKELHIKGGCFYDTVTM